MNRITVLLADDHEIVRHGLINLLSIEKTIKVVGEAANGREAIKKAKALTPDIVVIDIGMPELNGIEAAKQIIKELSSKVIALTIHNNIQYVKQMIKIGASGYLLKDCAVDELIEAIHCVYENKYYISKSISESNFNKENKEKHLLEEIITDEISGRETEVLQLIAEGNTTKIIADKLCISPKTVEAHRKNIMNKLNLHTIPELTRYAIKHGIIQLE